MDDHDVHAVTIWSCATSANIESKLTLVASCRDGGVLISCSHHSAVGNISFFV